MNENQPEKMPPVPPFVRFVASAVPMVFDDSLSYYEALCALWKYVQGMTDVINNNATLEEEYIEKFNELKSYVENYFDNLDVQEEINNKLDEMAEDGTLEEIMSSYLSNKAVWGFDSVADMQDATNLINGSFARTYGFHDKNDGGSALYKIRTITNDDVVDNVTIIALDNDDTLIAELVVENNQVTPEIYGAYGDGTHDDTIALQNAINSGMKVLAGKIYSVSSIAVADTELEITGEIRGIVNINNNAYVHGGDITTTDTDPCVIFESKLDNHKGNLNSKLEKCNLHPSSTGIGIKLFSDNNALFDFSISDIKIDSCDKSIYIHNKTRWITKGDFENIFCSSPSYAIFVDNEQTTNTYCADMTFRNVYAQYDNVTQKPINYLKVNTGNCILITDCSFCYDGIKEYWYYINPESIYTRIYILGQVKIDPKDAKYINLGNVRNMFFLPQYGDDSIYVKTSTKREMPIDHYGGMVFESFSAPVAQKFCGMIARSGLNDGSTAPNNVYGLSFYKGRVTTLRSTDGTVANATITEVTTPYSGAVYTSATLPTGSNVLPGATCWCSDLKMPVTYYASTWWKPDGTALV